jgi:hypothetical protein
MIRRSGAKRLRVALAVALVLGVGSLSCGASIQAVYEGNVRFEHCMALDSRPEIKPTIRRACWEEWVKFYTFGQTRDRVEYARQRRQQLVGASDFDEGEWSPLKQHPGEAAAVPEPTSAAAPPPMMLQVDGGSVVDAGSRDAAVATSSSATPDAKPPSNAECTAACDSEWTLCQHECRAPNCEKGCQAKYKKCMKRCF